MTKTKDQTAKSDVAAILLAAGRSSRMGAFKPLLPFGNKTVIQSCIDYLRTGGIEEIVVVVGHQEENVREHLKGASVHFAVNQDPDSAMGVSIGCGVRALPTVSRATLIALVDHPAVPAAVVAALIAERQKGSALVIPTWQERGGHPVLVDLQFRQQLESLDQSGGLKAFFAAHGSRVKRIAVNSPYVARDMDTWDDYRALYLEIFGNQPPAPHFPESNENSRPLI
ncbi:MAG TPA: nucleotidyltransferase family protein [Pyrinomonadaceae bacterium]|nr:nucleotidyltransferase family protein [Pyrinomonadaceae bacterium]